MRRELTVGSMAKKKTRRPQPASRPQPAPLTDSERGEQAFARNDYDSAISAWSGVLRARASIPVSTALAEAHFRRACKNLRKAPAQALVDLKTASNLRPDDAVYLYHLGLQYHRLGDLPNAIKAYRQSLRNDPVNYQRTAFQLCLAVAESGRDPTADSSWELLGPEQQNQLHPAHESYSAAVEHLSQGNFDLAEPHLRKAHVAFRGFAHYYLGIIAWRHGHTVEALAHWLSALNAGFDTPSLRHNLVSAYSARGIEQLEAPALLDLVRAALNISPESPMLLKLRQHAEFTEGNTAARSGDWPKALEHWQAAVRSDPRHTGSRALMSNVALAYERLERWTEAAETWREIIRKRPRHGENAWSKEYIVETWKHIDSLYARTGYFGKSVDVLRHAIRAQPDDLALRLALVKRHIENQNWRSAKSAVHAVLEIKPQHPEARFLYAQIVDSEGDLDVMIDAWEKVTETGDPRFGGLARKRLITLYAERGDFYFSVDDAEAGAADYAKALKLDPDDAVLRLRYGIALIHDDPKLAREQFERVDLADDDVAITVVSAWHAADDHAEAARWLKSIARTKKPGALLLAELGADLSETNPQIASTYFSQALDQITPGDPDAPRLLTMIAVATAESGDEKQAVEYAKRALKLDPKFGPAHFNMGVWDAAKGRRQAALKSWRLAIDWANKIKRSDIVEGIEEAIQLLEERHAPTLDDILDIIDPDGHDMDTRRLMGSLAKRTEDEG
jgi:tetratricopeptide (TPR) repeat protein